jgi:hypothetical protein
MKPAARWLVAVVATLASPPAYAASPFDGPWHGTAQGSQASSAVAAAQCVATIAAAVANGVLKGTLTFPRTTAPFGGTIAPDGSFTSTGGSITGKFEGGSFTGSMTVPNGYCNPYRVTMKHS